MKLLFHARLSVLDTRSVIAAFLSASIASPSLLLKLKVIVYETGE